MKFLLQVTSNFARAFDDLLDMYEQVGEQLDLLGTYGPMFESRPHMKRVLEMIYVDILNFHSQALAYFGKKSKLGYACLRLS